MKPIQKTVYIRGDDRIGDPAGDDVERRVLAHDGVRLARRDRLQRRVQTGLVTNYALAIALGMVVLLAIFLGISSTLFR